MKIKVVSIPDCRATPPTIALVKETAEEMGIEIEFRHLICKTTDEAQEHRLIGSPTIQINGLDIEPQSRTITECGIA